MALQRFSLIDDGALAEIDASVHGDTVRVAADAIRATLGWELKPQGLCRDAVCVPVHDGAALGGDEGIDLAALAVALGRPLALDVAERTAYLGASAADRGAHLARGEAPDIVLPDLDGRPHRLSDYRGRKTLLVAYASW